MIVPCIDLMDGKVVQLVQGRDKALEGDSPEEMLRKFAAFPEIQVIDLDAAMGNGENNAIVEELASKARIRAGGGVRTVERARELLSRLKNSNRTSVWTVMLAEPLPDSETARLLKDVQQLQLPRGPLVVNRLLFPEDVGSCLRCNQARRWQLATIARLRKRYRKHEIYAVRNFPAEIAGTQRLRAFTSELWRLA